MKKILPEGVLTYENSMLKFVSDNGGYACFTTNDKSIFDYIQSEREFFREMDYFYKLSELKTKLSNRSQLYQTHAFPYI
jgi:hypothetical protein